MRKVKALILAFTAVLILTACGGGTKAIAKAVSIATQALEVADTYLDGGSTSSEATKALRAFDMDYVSNDNSDSHTADFAISTDLTLLSHAITMESIDKSSKSYDDFLEARNKLATDAGLKKR